MRSIYPLVLLVVACAPKNSTSSDSDASTSTGPGTASAASTSTTEPTPVTTTTATSTTTAASTTVEPTTTTTSTTGNPVECAQSAVDDCCCLERGNTLVQPVCPYNELCYPIEVFCPDANQGNCPVDVIDVLNPEELDCTLDALAGSEAGQVLWAITPMGGTGWVQSRTVYVVGDGTAFIISGDFFGLDSHMNDVVQLQLNPPGYFTGCKLHADPHVRFDCLREGLGEPLQVCIPGYDFEWDRR